MTGVEFAFANMAEDKRRLLEQVELWCAEFSFLLADEFAGGGPNSVGCMLAEIEKSPRASEGFDRRVSAALARRAFTPVEPAASFEKLRTLFLEAVEPTNGLHKPGFSLPSQRPSFGTILNTSVRYGMDYGMGEMRKITVEVPRDLLESAQDFTGEGVTETVRLGLHKLASVRAQQKARELRGKIKFGVDLMALRKLED